MGIFGFFGCNHDWKFKFINMLERDLHECNKCGALKSGSDLLKAPYGKAHIEPFGGSSVDASLKPEAQSAIVCPKCESTQLTANKQGFGLRKAVVGGALLGGVGLLGGFVGAGNVQITCLKCGHQWQAGAQKSPI